MKLRITKSMIVALALVVAPPALANPGAGDRQNSRLVELNDRIQATHGIRIEMSISDCSFSWSKEDAEIAHERFLLAFLEKAQSANLGKRAFSQDAFAEVLYFPAISPCEAVGIIGTPINILGSLNRRKHFGTSAIFQTHDYRTDRFKFKVTSEGHSMDYYRQVSAGSLVAELKKEPIFGSEEHLTLERKADTILSLSELARQKGAVFLGNAEWKLQNIRYVTLRQRSDIEKSLQLILDAFANDPDATAPRIYSSLPISESEEKDLRRWLP